MNEKKSIYAMFIPCGVFPIVGDHIFPTDAAHVDTSKLNSKYVLNN